MTINPPASTYICCSTDIFEDLLLIGGQKNKYSLNSGDKDRLRIYTLIRKVLKSI